MRFTAGNEPMISPELLSLSGGNGRGCGIPHCPAAGTSAGVSALAPAIAQPQHTLAHWPLEMGLPPCEARSARSKPVVLKRCTSSNQGSKQVVQR